MQFCSNKVLDMSSIDSFLQVQCSFIKLIGFDLYSKVDSWQQPYRGAPFILALSTIAPFITAAVLHNVKEVDLFCDAMCALLITFLGLFKFVMIVYLRGDLAKLVVRFRQMINKELRRGDDYRHIIVKENRWDQNLSRFFKNSLLMAWLINGLLPFVYMISNYRETAKIEPFLPFPCDFPWEMHSIRNYIICYLWSICASMAVVLPAVSIDTLFCGFTHNLCAFFKIAQCKMMNFRGASQKDTEDNLKEIFKLYQDCLDMCLQLNQCFEPLICAQFFTSSLQLCVVGYLFSRSFNQPQGMYYAAYMLSMTFQAYSYCYCGEYLKTESTNFALAIYNSPWYEERSSSKIRRSLLISLIRAQRGCRITGYFFEANMQAFSAIVRSAMSYITMLRSFS